MKIVVGFISSPAGKAALDRAIEEVQLRQGELVVVHSMEGGDKEDADEVLAYREELAQVERRLTDLGVPHRIHEYVRGQSPSQDLIQCATEENAELIVIGLRRRSAVGKLLLGSNAQEILLDAKCPVLAVKATQ
ncbi:MAG TPA: universal stress protein [Acidimicrobiia bacterium]|jgi:nucleotide-binding universal stress UspA family protein|nr:universal stress protein [Acidimicrobiia bacterium]